MHLFRMESDYELHRIKQTKMYRGTDGIFHVVYTLWGTILILIPIRPLRTVQYDCEVFAQLILLALFMDADFVARFTRRYSTVSFALCVSIN